VTGRSPLALRTPARQPVIVSFAVAILLLVSSAFGQESELKHWDLGLSTTDGDVSPDDRFVAVTSTSRVAAQIVEFLEVWDFRQQKKIATAQLATYSSAERVKYPVRFTADGLLLAAADRTRLHVFEGASLRTARLIEPPLPEDFRISAVESSPIGHAAIIAAWKEKREHDGMLFAYDLDTGRLLFDWKPPSWVRPISISWKPDGTEFAVAATDPSLDKGCRLHIFSTSPWRQVREVRGKTPCSIAFTNSHLYAVGGSLFGKGHVFRRHLGMTVFDTNRWKRQKTIFLPGKDIHDSVSFANVRLLADTGTVKTSFDWTDMVGYASASTAQFTLWEGEAQSILLTSPQLSISRRELSLGLDMRLSRSGKMVLVNPKNPQVFQLP